MTEPEIELKQLKTQIVHLKAAADTLGETGRHIPAVSRNMARIAASIKMLELNICDIPDPAEM